VKSPVVSVTPAYSGTGSGLVVTDTKLPNGNPAVHALAEVITGRCASISPNGSGSFAFSGQSAVAPLAYDWPSGTGVLATVATHTATSQSNLITNADFAVGDDDETQSPTGWIPGTATIGTTLHLTNTEVQTVVISGTPTSGWYQLHFTNQDSEQQSTTPLAYNAPGADVQTALRALNGLGSITVATTGTDPDFTHTITFVNVPNPGVLTSTEVTDSGAIAHATTVAGATQVFRGARSLEFVGDGAQLTDIYVPVNVAANTAYMLFYIKQHETSTAAGEFEISLVDGIGGTVITDDEAVACETGDSSIIAGGGTWDEAGAVFRTPAVLPETVYLRIKVTTAITAAKKLWFHEIGLVEMTELYRGGPNVAVFTGETHWLQTGQTNESEITLTVATNVTTTAEGAIHRWLDRIFALRESRLYFPSTTGAPDYADSLIT